MPSDSNTTDRQRLLRLADAFVDDIMSMTDEEILCEAIEDGLDPNAVAAKMRRLFERAAGRVKYGK
jgi:hypothetical protein